MRGGLIFICTVMSLLVQKLAGEYSRLYALYNTSIQKDIIEPYISINYF